MASVLSQLMGQWMDVQGLLIFLCVLLLVKHLRDVLTNNMPPGPFPLPLVGNILNIGFSDPLGSFQRIAERYGDVSTLYMGNNPCILLTGYESFKEAFVEQADIFTDRPYFPTIGKLTKGKGLIFSSGHMWRQQRRFALATLKYFGVGKKTLENSILQECRFLCDSIQSERVAPLLKSILQDKKEYSTPYEFNPAHFLDENGTFLKKESFIPFSIGKRMCPGEQLARMELFLFFTSLMQHFTFLPLERQTLSLKGTIGVSSGPESFQIHSHYKRITHNILNQLSTIRGLLIFLCVLLLVKHLRDVFTNNMPPGPFPLPLVGNILNIGFSDPLGSFQRIAEKYGDVSTLYLGNNPCILLTGYESFKEAFVEQADIFTDRPYFPLVDKLSKGKGLIMSSGHMWRQQRRFALATLKYFGVGKKTLENFILQECRFLCDSIQNERVMPLLKSILQDKNEYSTPYEFNPAHFLDENGKFVKKDSFIPFSIGKTCPYSSSV
ncbi:Cytochrome P450 2A9 [Labeo rohita]|uniref:Cytochrome P450 2A9 n=1 Tax=Labeo rohita TaxID=84645 RepID=A0ABQ8LGG7_LABRO|nr:Cytochrome P450 2A9 [Labeo rohita]